MKRFIYLLNAIFLLLFTKSFIFANDLESKVNYLLELSKNNVSQASSLMSMLGLLTAFFGLVFISIVVYIIIRLIELAKQIKANKEVLQTIEKHSEGIATLAKETAKIRNEIRDQNLMSTGITDQHYAKLLDEVLGWEVTQANMNIIKNLVWRIFTPREYGRGIGKLRAIFSKSDVATLMDTVRKKYYETFKETAIDNSTLLSWIYEIKEKGEKTEDLLYEEAKRIIDLEKAKEKVWHTGAFERYYKRKIVAAKELLKEKGEELSK